MYIAIPWDNACNVPCIALISVYLVTYSYSIQSTPFHILHNS